MKNKICLLLMLMAAVMATFAVAAENDATETVIVPFDVTKPVESQKPDQVYIPYERFLQLWEAAKANKRGFPSEEMPQPYVLSSARYDSKLDSGVLSVNGVIDLQTFNDGWVNVPLAFREVKIGVLKLDGQPAPLADGAVAIEKAGHHRIEVEFEIPVGSDKARTFSWGIPQTAGTLFSITLPDRQMKAGLQPGCGVVERINGDRKVVTAALGSTDHVELSLDSSVGLSTITQAAVAKIDATLSITPAVELVHAGFEFSFPESQQDHFTVSLDKALALVNLDVPNLKSWKLTVGNDNQVLEITLGESVSGSFKFSIDAERSLAERQRHFPYISAAANRIEQTVALFSTPFLDVTPQPASALRQIPFSAGQDQGLRLVAAFSSTGDRELLAYEVQPAKLSNKADISYVYQVNHSKIELVAALKLRMKDATLFDVSLGLPGDFVVQAVESDRLKDWWREGGTLHVRFKGEAPGAATQLVLHLVKQFKTVPDALEIKPLTLPDTWDVEGNGIIAASSSVEVAMTLSDAKEINPQTAATDFRILPPMERKRGFSFKGRDFHAAVKLETLPPRVNGTWVMSAQAHESWVSVSTYVNLTARQGSAGEASFRLPASSPEARVSGDNVRESTSAVEGNWRVYHVAFQNDLTDQTGFAVDFDLPGNGEASLPAFELTGVERADGFVIVDNASEYEMQVQPAGLEVALSQQIPFLAQVSRNARLFHALPGWTLQISLTKLEKETGRSAFVEWAELTTAIRADGSEWYRASYHLQNRSLQFLPVKLPDGAELASVSVAGENVRADKGSVDGKEVLLVPLIKTRPGDASYDVNLVYRKRKTGGFWTFGHESLADPEVVGITVERTLWNLYVPDGSDAGHFGGNMEEVLDEVNQTEKLEGMLDELKRLNDLVLNGESSETTRNAGENFKKLARSLDEKSKSSDEDRLYGSVDQDLQSQSNYASRKKQEIQKELEDQKQAFEGNIAKSRQSNAYGVMQQERLGTAPQKRAVTQTWVNNGAFVSAAKDGQPADREKEIDRKNTEGKQLYVNDYVVNVQAATQAPVAATYYSRGITQNTMGNNITAGGGAANVTINSAGTTANNNASLSINGNIASISSNALVEAQASQIQDQQVILRRANPVEIPATAAAPASSADTGAALEDAQDANVKVLNNARANPDAEELSSTRVQMAKMRTTMKAQAKSPPGADGSDGFANQGAVGGDLMHDDSETETGAPAGLASLSKPAAAASASLEQAQAQMQGEAQDNGDATFRSSYNETTAQGAGGSGVGFGGGGYIQQGPAQLQPAGAISLPVDFPTEGHVYHFKKLKGNAKLAFWVTNQQGLDKWKWLLLFLVAAVVIKSIFKFIDRGYQHLARRRIAHFIGLVNVTKT